MTLFDKLMLLCADGMAPEGLRIPQIVDKPWGREIWYADEDVYAGKILCVKAGHRLSEQYHVRKKETLMVLDGQVEILLAGRTTTGIPGIAFTIEPNTVHRFSAVQDSVLLEVSTPDLDDVVRISDDYRRN